MKVVEYVVVVVVVVIGGAWTRFIMGQWERGRMGC